MPAWLVEDADGVFLQVGLVGGKKGARTPWGHKRGPPETCVPQVWDMVRITFRTDGDHLGGRPQDPDGDCLYMNGATPMVISPTEVSSHTAPGPQRPPWGADAWMTLAAAPSRNPEGQGREGT